MRVALPFRYAVNCKIHKNSVQQLECDEIDEEVDIEDYNRYGVTGKLLSVADREILVVDHQTSSKMVKEVLMVQDLEASGERWNDTGQWLYPKPCLIDDSLISSADVLNSWSGDFNLIEESSIEGRMPQKGLRSPQIGALYAVLAHWRVSTEEATIVLPTGTGKTEAMLAVFTRERLEKLIVIVPSNALREQLSRKFLSLGVLKKFGILSSTALFPIVGKLCKGLDTAEKVRDFFGRCNVIITTMSALTACSGAARKEFARLCTHMFVDEAHHLRASTWYDFRRMVKLYNGVIVQFTATPFREDGLHLPGKIVFNYPLRKAQEDGYFTRIDFLSILEFDDKNHDLSIANAAVEQLKKDLETYNHVVMARVNTIARAENVYEIYKKIAFEYEPVLVHSKLDAVSRREALEKLVHGTSKVIVCVDMFGEGFDYPSLKIAALHDIHKSLAITLQFTGRFTRTQDGLGSATVIANLARTNVVDALEHLYAEDADWNGILSVLSTNSVTSTQDFQDFLAGFSELDSSLLSIQNISPAMSTVIYDADIDDWRPQGLREQWPEEDIFAGPYINPEHNIAFIVIQQRQEVAWGKISHIADIVHQLYVVFWDKDHRLLFINSSVRQGKQLDIAKAITRLDAPKQIDGEDSFRVFGGMQPLTLINLGLKSVISKYVQFTMFVGSDIKSGLDVLDQQNRIMSNMFGQGYSLGKNVGYGCSRSGKIWSYSTAKDILAWVRWCKEVGGKVKDDSYTIEKILEHVLIPREIIEIPKNHDLIGVEWNEKIWVKDEVRYCFVFTDGATVNTVEFFNVGVRLHDYLLPSSRNRIDVEFVCDFQGIEVVSKFSCDFSPGRISYSHSGNAKLHVESNGNRIEVEQFLERYPLLFRFSLGSVLLGNSWYEIKFDQDESFDAGDIQVRTWDGIDLRKESRWNNGEEQLDSIQYYMLKELIDNNSYDLIVDDDGAGEAADVVAVKVDKDRKIVVVELYHLKYSEKTPGARVSDLYEVCGQAQRSAHWKGHLLTLFSHLRSRCRGTKNYRYVKGSEVEVKMCEYWVQRLDVEFRVFIVQPGLQKSKVTDSQKQLLAATRSYLHYTQAIPLTIIASA